MIHNQGSGLRSSANYQIPVDIISDQPVDFSASVNYTLHGRPLVTVDTASPTGGLYINGNSAATATPSVTLQLIASHPAGIVQMQLSNNGVGWTEPESYATARAWTLTPVDGARRVYAKYQAGNGVWSGPVWDSILLDTTAPTVSISPTGGTYMDPQRIAVTASEPAFIRYTTDGSDPVTSPTAQGYAGPVYLSGDAVFKAYAVDAVGHAGAVASETYEICAGSNLSISGTVLDATRANAPMPFVVITLSNGQQVSTDPSGQYAFTGLPRGWYTIQSVTAPMAGYVTYQSKLKLCDSSVSLDIVLTRDGTVYGTDTSSGYSTEGVNTSTGNFTYKMSDLALPGIGPSFVFERAYNSQDKTDGPLGVGWTWSNHITLTEEPEGEIVVRWGDGKIEVWKPDGSDGYEPMYGVFSTLVVNPDNTLTLRRKDRTEFRFDLTLRLAAIADEYGNTLAFSYSGDDLATVTDTAGRAIAFSHDASGRITNVLDPVGRSVSFAYDGSGNLASATDMDGQTTRYTYDEYHQMLTLTGPDGRLVLTNTYDPARGVVTSQADALGRETHYLYDVPNRTTTVIDAEGNRTCHRFDDRLRLVEEIDGRGYSSTRTYDERGNVATATDKRGHTTTYAYDDKGNVLTKTEPLGRVTSATYDADSNPLTRTDALGHVTLFEYDPVNGNLLASYACGDVPEGACATDPTVAKTTYTYDALTGQLLTVTEATGTALERTTTYQYDIEGNRVAVIDALGNVSAYDYDGVGRKLIESHPLGRATAFEYDAMDRLITVTDALGQVSQFTYDVNGNKTRHLDPRLYPTDFTYDAKGRLVSQTNALGGVETYCYDGVDRRTGVTNQRGATALIVYDAVGNVVQEVDALGNVVRHEYDPNGNRTATVNARGHRTTFTYDALNRLVATTDPLGRTTAFEYDLNGNRTRVTDPLGQSTRFVYDGYNRLIQTVDPLGHAVTNAYDLLGRLTGVTDARGYETRFAYDALDRLVGVTDTENGTVAAAYDALGNRLSVTDPRGHQTTYAYDVLNRLVSETDPLGQSVIRSYDAAGNLLTLVNADGTTSYAVDALSRVTAMTFPDLTTAAYAYDARGNRLSVADTSGATTYAYDLLDQLTAVIDPFGLTVGYTYDPDGNRNGLVYPGNRRVTYRLDAVDRLIEVQDWGGIRTTYAYDAAGRLSTQTMGNGATVTYAYDDAGRLTGKEDRDAGGAVIASYSFTLDANGNRTGTELVQPLLPAAEALSKAFTHNDGNQVVSDGVRTYTYDGKGNRRSATDGVTTTLYDYDFNNRLTRVDDGQHVDEYLYNSDGQRLAAARDGAQTRYLLDTAGSMEWVLAELDAGNAVKRFYVYGDGLLYSVDGATGERLFYHYDPLGSTVALADLSGVVTDAYAYLPYGEPADRSGSHENPFTYVGRHGVMQEIQRLFFMRSRFYDPETRVFLSMDLLQGSIGETQSINRYCLVQGNPLIFIDPTGQVRWGQFALGVLEVGVGIAGVIGGAATAPTGIGIAAFVVGGCTAIQGFADIADSFRDRRTNVDPLQVVAGVAAAIAFKNKEAVDIAQTATGLAETAFSFGHSVSGYITAATKAEAVGKLALLGAKATKAIGSYLIPFDRNDPASNSTRLSSADVNMLQGQANRSTVLRGNYSGMNVVQSTASGSSVLKDEAKTSKPRPPKRYLNVIVYAQSAFRKEYRHILAPDFLDEKTLSIVELGISYEISILQQNRYSYRPDRDKSKRKAKERRAQDVANAINRLYSQLTSALSKHQVLIRDLARLPSGATGGVATAGVYAGGN